MPSSMPNERHAVATLIQLTDSHLFAQDGASLMGMDTAESLHEVVKQVQHEHPHIDLILATGDIAQDGSVRAYERFLTLTRPLEAPVRWLAGNHDDVATLIKVGRHSELENRDFNVGNWRILLLNSAVEGQVAGFLAKAELERLEQSLINYPNKHHLVCLHHHPVDIGCEWMAPIGLQNTQDLWSVLGRYTNVRALLWGHVHQRFDQVQNGIRLLASPSTCIQFTPGSIEFSVSDQAPGYRWFKLYEEGELETGISRAEGYTFVIDRSTQGY